MRFAIVGTRGIPARYGGFETFAEEIIDAPGRSRPSATVYCRERYTEPEYRGVHLKYLPTIRHKYFDTVVHTFLSTLHVLTTRQDAVLYCNAANAVFTWMPRALRNAGGVERRRTGAESQEMESRRTEPGIACRNGWRHGCRPS